jgi:hypothetical protein
MKWALVNSENVVINIIVYEGSPFSPPDGLSLLEINDWVDIGMKADISLADIPKATPPDAANIKKQRDMLYKDNLAIVALFNMVKNKQPDLDFSSYLDSLEILKNSIVLPA